MERDKFIGELARWALLLQEFEFEVVHKVGTSNLNVDGFLRIPNPLEEICDWSQMACRL